MNFPARCLCVTIFFVSLVAHAQTAKEMDRRSFMALSATLAYELGKTYQMGQNCDKDLSSIGPARTEGLFGRYMKGKDFKQTMIHYNKGMQDEFYAVCDREELKASGAELIARMTQYGKIADPFR
jgi:hypothetical protein